MTRFRKNTDGEETVPSDRPNRRAVLRSMAGASMVGLASGSAGATSFSEDEIYISEETEVKDTAAEIYINEYNNRPSRSKSGTLRINKSDQKKIGGLIEEHASELLKKLSSKGIFEEVSVDAADLLSGKAFSTLDQLGRRNESAYIHLIETKENTIYSRIFYEFGQSRKEGRIDKETKVTIGVVPETDASYTIISPKTGGDLPNSDSGSDPTVRHRLISPDFDAKSKAATEGNDEIAALGQNDAIIMRTCFTYCLKQPGYCQRIQVCCSGGTCDTQRVGSCVSGCQTAKCTKYRNPC